MDSFVPREVIKFTLDEEKKKNNSRIAGNGGYQ